jgi:hypothetical protein
MDPGQDDSAPAGSSDTGGTPYRAAHEDSRSERDNAAAADPMAAARATTVIPYRVTTETSRMRQDVVFRVGARLGKKKREELDNASTAVCGIVLRFTRTFEQYIEEIRPDSTKEEMIELLREFLSDTMNFVHRQVLQTSALHILHREVLFPYGAVEKPVGGGFIPSSLTKVLVPDKDGYAILADVLREARAKNNSDFSMDDEDLQSRTSEETHRAQRTRTIDSDGKKSFLFQASADDKISAPSDAGSDKKVKMEGLAQRTIGSENKHQSDPYSHHRAAPD